jgi:HD-GYP domain-containing protein (c-di-GMP phosphodiesterase class II)
MYPYVSCLSVLSHGILAEGILPLRGRDSMVRIPFLRRQPKPDSSQGEDGKKTTLPGSPPGKDQLAHPFVLGTDKKTPFPPKPPGEHEVEQPPEASSVEKTALPESLPDERQSEQLSGAGTTHGDTDVLSILQAMPDYVFRIGPEGVLPVGGNGSNGDAGLVSHSTPTDKPTNSEGVAGENEKPKTLHRIICEELAHQSQQHVDKVRETGQVQTFDLQVHDDRQLYHFEVRLMAFGQSEVLALVRDVTLLRQTHNALIESRSDLENHLRDRNAELIRVNKMLKTEVSLRLEEEDMLRKSFTKLERLLDDTIGAITTIVEKKDPYMIGHQQRVSQLSCAIGREMGLASDQMRVIRIAALLHDWGKIFIPAEILRKPGKLSQAEISLVRTHPDVNYEILKKIDFSGSIADIVRQHHERMDGSGYPLGLKGGDILMEARIIGVADVIESMVTNRPYRPALGEEEALKEIADKKGTLYDPAVVDSCLKLFAEKRFKFDPLPGQENAGSGGGA